MLYFTADNGVNGRELWKSDGTTSGTVLVKDINPGSSSSAPERLTAVGNTLYFTANNGVNGRELWKSDGTTSGTVLVKDINPSSSSSYPFNSVTAVGNTLYFDVDDGINGIELWQSDGTASGTVLVKDINPGSSSSSPRYLTAVGNTLYFHANDGINGLELWALNTDSAPAPTSLAISSTSADQTEGNSGSKAFTFTVTRSGATTGTNNVNWAVTGTGTNPANATDFVGGVLPSGVVSFGAGQTSKVITVNVQGDTTVEPNETFTVTLSNPTNGATLTASAATGTIQNDDTPSGSTFTGTTGNDTLNGTTGADTLIGLAGNDTYTVNNTGDVVVENPNEGTDTVKSTISYALGANVENLTLNGTANLNGTGNGLKNRITGNAGNNILNGGVGADILAGKAGNDTFVFQFGQSTITALDRITDFAIGSDKIDLLTQGGAALNKPAGFTRAADSATTNINTIVANVFADSNGAQAGNQALGLNRAALVKAGTSTYLIVNDGTAGFQSANDLVINLTGITGTLPAFGTIPVGNFFV